MGVYRSGGLGDGAVVELDLLGDAFEDDAGGDAGTGGDVDAFGGGESAGADDDGDVDVDVAGVVDLNGDEPADVFAVACGEIAGSDVDDGEVGEAAVVVDPVVEELGEIFVGCGFEDSLEVAWVLRLIGRGVADFVAVELQGAFEGGVSCDGAEHEEDGCGFGAVVEFVVGGDEGLALLCGRRWKCRREQGGWGGVVRLGGIGTGRGAAGLLGARGVLW